MTVAFDAASFVDSFTTTTPADHTHTPVGTPRAALAFIGVSNSGTDIITGPVTYGGVTMALVEDSVLGGGEPGRTEIYFLGASIPTGAQTVSVTHTGAATVKSITVVTLTAAGDCEVGAFGELMSASVTDPSIALDTGAVSSLRLATVYSGTNSPGTFVELSGQTLIHAVDYGLNVQVTSRRNAVASGSEAIGWTGTVSTAMTAVAVQEIAGGAATVTPAVVALTTTLPSPTILAASKVVPAVVPIVAALPTPSILAAAKVTPAVIPLAVTLPTPTIVVEGATVVTPAVIAVIASLPTPAILAAAKVTPAVIPLAALLPTPTVIAGVEGVATPAVIAVTVGLPTPSIGVDAVVTPAGIALVVTVPTPGVTTPGLVTPAGISLIVTLPTPLATVGAITFWEKDPVNFVKVGPGDQPPWN